jgi:23S rRNA pseudouridine2605 synthase
MFNVGRLDLASEGLILVTNDGPLANQLTHPSHGVEKIYEVQVAGMPEPDVLAQIKKGVHLAEGFVHAVDVRVKGRKKGSTLLEMVLDEGRNREIRRLLARLGHKAQRLVRVAVGPIRLGDMPRGAVRLLTPEEVRKLRDAAAAGRRQDGEEAAGRASRRPAGRSRKPVRPAAAGGAGRPRKKRSMTGDGEPTRRIIGEEPSANEAPRPGKPRSNGGPPKRPSGPGVPGQGARRFKGKGKSKGFGHGRKGGGRT